MEKSANFYYIINMRQHAQFLKKTAFAAIMLFSAALLAAEVPAFPRWGADAVPDLYAPNLAGSGGFSTGIGGAPASAINPAQGGTAQRIIFDLGYLGLAGFGNEKGYGNAIEAGGLFPTRYGVFGASLKFIQSPFDASFPVKWGIFGNINAAKEVYPRVSVGAGINFGVGAEWLWNLSGDLGFHWNIGTVGPFENFTWAVVLRSMGISWAPTWFTPASGLSLDLISIKGKKEGKKNPFKLNSSFNLEIPSAFYIPQTSLILKLGLKAVIAETVNISLAWPGGSGLNVRELAKGVQFTAIPSVGLGVNIILHSKDKKNAGRRLPSDGELAIDTAYKPLYYGVTALGAGITWTVGIADKKAPVTVIEYPQEQYFSPNNDGKGDYLEFPISITDERYVENWEWVIKDEDGNAVRSFKNKELRPETQGISGFFSRLSAVKTQVEVPPALRWDGIGDSGEMMPDGRYFFTVSAADDSGNAMTSETFSAVLKNAPPEVSIEAMDDAMRVFSPGGGGSKNAITITPKGSYEDAWESGIYNSSGEKIRSFENINGNPVPVTWDGRNDSGEIAPDGVYRFIIGATDKAQNSAEAALGNIIVNTIRPEVSIIINDPWFSPNNDGVKDSLAMNLLIPARGEIVDWNIQIKDRSGALQRTISAKDGGGIGSAWTESRAGNVPDQCVFDGKNDSGIVMKEGEYRAELKVSYLNGYVSSAMSPSFTLKITPPSAKVSSEFSSFNYSGIQNEMIIKQEGTKELVWTGEVRRANAPAGEKPVRSYRFTGTPPSEIRWDGQGEGGSLAVDGRYSYELYATDPAGNTGRSNMLSFTLNTKDTPVLITADTRAFSPNGDGIKDTVSLIPRIQEKEGVVNYKIDVLNASGLVIRSFEGRGLPPEAISWNGRTTANAMSPEGIYTARIELRYEQGNQPNAASLPFELDITPPKGAVSTPFTLFSPNGSRSQIPLNVTSEGNDEWEAAIIGPGGRQIKTWNWKGKAPDIAWDGKDAAGNAAADGSYQFMLQSTDEAGNSARHNISNIVLDSRVPGLILTASAAHIAPKPNQSEELVRFNIMCSLQEGIDNWSLELKDEKGTAVKRFASPSGASARANITVPSSLSWNGLTDDGKIREGSFTPVLTVQYVKGDTATAEAAPVLVHVSGPVLSIAYRPEYFSPDNDGVDDDLFISLGAQSPAPIASWYLEIREPVSPFNLFYRIEGRGSPAPTVRWDGRSNRGELVQSATDYPVKYSATDILGNSSSIDSQIGVDVLVIRDGDRLRIMVPSIVFRENAADFIGIPADRAGNNIRVLRRIAEILNKFRDYKVQVEGHANPVTRTQREEREELQPLSEARARAIVTMLAEFGVARSRLSSIGMGGTKPVVQFEDRDNWWKNRRVEFILIK